MMWLSIINTAISKKITTLLIAACLYFVQASMFHYMHQHKLHKKYIAEVYQLW